MESSPALGYLAGALGWAGAVIFFSRFYVQWIYSEIKKRSAMPVAFWYMSTAGSLMLFAFAVLSSSPLGALGHCFNLVVYARNLIHIWREKGRLSRRLSRTERRFRPAAP